MRRKPAVAKGEPGEAEQCTLPNLPDAPYASKVSLSCVGMFGFMPAWISLVGITLMQVCSCLRKGFWVICFAAFSILFGNLYRQIWVNHNMSLPAHRLFAMCQAGSKMQVAF